METHKNLTYSHQNQTDGILVSFEGIDFCGKSIQIEQLISMLKANNIAHVLLREPGGTIIAEKIRETLLNKALENMNPITEYLLYSAARAQLVEQKIFPALHNGTVVICDRFYDSSTAYQGYGRGIDLEIIRQINNFATKGLKPHLTFLIDIDLDEMERRKKLVQRELDRMENQERSFFEKVRQGFLQIAEQESERFHVIDGKTTIEKIASEIWQSFKKISRNQDRHNFIYCRRNT